MKSGTPQKRIWIAWEQQRRTLELSKCFNCDLFLIIENGLLRYPVSIVKTFLIIRREKPDVLFVQNPSMVLAVFATTFFRLFFKYYVVVDRHSNFLLTPKKRFFFVEACFHFLSFISIKYANITIVTNTGLANVVEVLGGYTKVLPDKIPSISPEQGVKLPGNKNVLVISSFADDEPIHDIAEAASLLVGLGVYFHFTGDYSKFNDIDFLTKKNNIILTGFVPEQEFVDLLFSVDAVMVLTTMEYTLLCGCYEAIAAEKILITSSSLALKSLFHGAVFVDNTCDSIVDGVQYAFDNRRKNINSMHTLKNVLQIAWEAQFDDVRRNIELEIIES